MTPMANRNNDRHRERGAIAAMAGIMMLTLVGITVVGVDLGRLAFTASEVQGIADAAAPAYVRAMLKNKAAGSNVRTPSADANAVVQGNNVDGAAATAANIESYTEGTWDFDAGTFTPGGADPNAVQANATATVTNFFAQLFGTPSSKVDKNAIAAMSCPAGAHVLPIAVGDCSLFDPWHGSEDCDDLPQLFQQPGDNSCFTTLYTGGGGAGSIISMLPSQCCKGGNCGGGELGPLVGTGSTINLYNGQMDVILKILKDCVDNRGLTEFLIPIVECNDGVLNCSASAKVIGFATINFTQVQDTANPKYFNMDVLCNAEAPVQGQGAECFGTDGVAMVR